MFFSSVNSTVTDQKGSDENFRAVIPPAAAAAAPGQFITVTVTGQVLLKN